MKEKRRLFLALLLGLGLLAGCQDPGQAIQGQVEQMEEAGSGGFGYNDVTYDQPETYTVGGTELIGPVERVEIDWYGGSVAVVAANEGDEISFHETSNQPITEDLILRYRLQEGTLSLVYCQAGHKKLGGLEKDLVLQLPADLVLEELTIDTGAAPVKVAGLSAQTLQVDTGAGEIQLSGCQVTELTRLDTGSGKITAGLTGSLARLEADTGSGDVSVTAETLERLSVDTGSGSLTLRADALGELAADTGSGSVTVTAGTVDRVEVDTGSGDLTLTAGQAPKEMDVDLGAGQILLTLPENASFTAVLDTGSGKWTCDLPTTVQGDRYTCGDGGGAYRFSTTSGDVTIRKK